MLVVPGDIVAQKPDLQVYLYLYCQVVRSGCTYAPFVGIRASGSTYPNITFWVIALCAADSTASAVVVESATKQQGLRRAA